ncbi:MAG TPA: glycosyltransferase family 39 protein, partial [Polyangiaceae bacterium]|nr:glycosyltransferase family 39 protein [Polyangiaceae bacterium]
MSDKDPKPSGADEESEVSSEAAAEPREDTEQTKPEGGADRAADTDTGTDADTGTGTDADTGADTGTDADEDPDYDEAAERAQVEDRSEERESAEGAEGDEFHELAERTRAAKTAHTSEPESPGQDSPPDEPPLVPEGNPLRLTRGIPAAVLGSLLAFIVMAADKPLRAGVPLGALGVLIATFGLLDLIGSFDDKPEKVAHRATLSDLLKPLGLLLGASLGFGVALTLAVAGRLP